MGGDAVRGLERRGKRSKPLKTSPLPSEAKGRGRGMGSYLIPLCPPSVNEEGGVKTQREEKERGRIIMVLWRMFYR
jgi:hypothetical protein